jgi:hypothetical protein
MADIERRALERNARHRGWPDGPRAIQTWPITPIHRYTTDSQPEQRGAFPGWKGTNEHEGLDRGDIDGDDRVDIVGGGLWFKHAGGAVFVANPSIPPTPSRARLSAS